VLGPSASLAEYQMQFIDQIAASPGGGDPSWYRPSIGRHNKLFISRNKLSK
jgi:hypothetical protein